MKPKFLPPNGCPEDADSTLAKMREIADRFLSRLSEQQRESLGQRLKAGFGANDEEARIMVTKPDGTYVGPHMVRGFIAELMDSGVRWSSSAQLNDLLLERLQGFERTDVMKAGFNLLNQPPHAQGVIDRHLAELKDPQALKATKICASLMEDADLQEVAVLERIPLKSLVAARTSIQVLMRKTGADEMTVRKAVLQRLKAVPISEDGPSIQSGMPGDSVTLRKIRIADGRLNDEMSPAEFVRKLTDEGREMVIELLLLGDEIRDASAIKMLEQKSGRSGYTSLAMHIIVRLNANPGVKEELNKALKKAEVAREKRPAFASEGAKGPKQSLAQIVAGFRPEEKRLLLAELRLSKSGFDGGKPIVLQMLPRCTRLMTESGLDPELHMGQLQLLLEGKSPTGSHKERPFAKTRAPEKPVTYSPWAQPIRRDLLAEIGPFADGMTSNARKILLAVLNTENMGDPAEIARMIMEHAPGTTRQEFDRMNEAVIRLAKQLARPLESVKEALSLKLEGGGQALPAGRPGMSDKEARLAPTVLSSYKQKDVLDRLRNKKKS